MHPEAFDFVARVAQRIGPRRRVLEMGSRDINGSVRPLFACPYVGIDLEPGSGVDVVADGATYEPTAPIDTLVCCEVLEHTEAAEQLVRHGLSLLPPDGVAIFTCATFPRLPHSALDGGPLRPGEFYRNISEHKLLAWILTSEGGINALELHEDRGDLYCWAVKARVRA